MDNGCGAPLLLVVLQKSQPGVNHIRRAPLRHYRNVHGLLPKARLHDRFRSHESVHGHDYGQNSPWNAYMQTFQVNGIIERGYEVAQGKERRPTS